MCRDRDVFTENFYPKSVLKSVKENNISVKIVRRNFTNDLACFSTAFLGTGLEETLVDDLKRLNEGIPDDCYRGPTTAAPQAD
ncbi:hypothetical protein AAVH_19609, partial [Aphelenchoides avenae]